MASNQVVSFMNEALTADKTSAAATLGANQGSFIGVLVGTAVDAGTTVDCTIEHSPDKVNWFTLASFAQLSGADGSEAINITDNVFLYVRGVADLGGTEIATVKLQLWYDPGKNR